MYPSAGKDGQNVSYQKKSSQQASIEQEINSMDAETVQTAAVSSRSPYVDLSFSLSRMRAKDFATICAFPLA